MQSINKSYCEICGNALRNKGIIVRYEGSVITVCESCYSKIKKNTTTMQLSQKSDRSNTQRGRIKVRNTTIGNVEFEVVEDYAKRIREAREKLGLSHKQLADKLKVSENVIKRFENNKLKPTITQARELEKILGIKLIVPVEGKEELEKEKKEEFELTLGDIVNIREGKK
jgi:putative transcription factor